MAEICGLKWWAWQGLNLRPLRCQGRDTATFPPKTAIFLCSPARTLRERIGNRTQVYRTFTAQEKFDDCCNNSAVVFARLALRILRGQVARMFPRCRGKAAIKACEHNWVRRVTVQGPAHWWCFKCDARDEGRAASCDTHPKDGDAKQAPLVSGAVPEGQTPTPAPSSQGSLP